MLTDPDIRLVVHVLRADVAVKFRLLYSFPGWTRYRGFPPEGSDWRLGVLDSAKSQDPFSGSRFFDVAPQHALLGHGHGKLPSLRKGFEIIIFGLNLISCRVQE